MEEELTEEEIEERLYAMIHHVDESQPTVEKNVEAAATDTAVKPQVTVPRYWRTSGDLAPVNSPYQKINHPNKASGRPMKATSATTASRNATTASRNAAAQQNIDTPNKATGQPPNRATSQPPNRATSQHQTTNPLIKTTCTQESVKTTFTSTDSDQVTIPKEERTSPSPNPAVITNFAAIQLDNAKTTIKILDNDDDVIEVALPPKPTFTIESSDEDELVLITEKNPDKNPAGAGKEKQRKSKKRQANRDHSASPVPSVVSSVSDDFIRGDCIALNISSQNNSKQSFDFSLHGSDLLGTPTRKKKKKKNKEKHIPIPVTTPTKKAIQNDTPTFATPKNKTKSKKQKNKQYAVSQQSLPNPDIYDSDSNQCFDHNRKEDSYKVTDKSLPSADVYESDSSQSEIIKGINPASKEKNSNEVNNFGSSSSLLDTQTEQVTSLSNTIIATITPQKQNDKMSIPTCSIVDLTENVQDNDVIIIENTSIPESIVMANVTGFQESDVYEDSPRPSLNMPTDNNPSKFGSTKVPAILMEDHDFDYLKGSRQAKRQYSELSLRAEMEKFYNESWGGENFSHRELQKTMSRDRSLWEIDPKDRFPSSPYRQKMKCRYCNRFGHREDTCHQKPAVCHMCGNHGHQETRCPNKICVNCGSPNYMYSAVCSACAGWRSVVCAECAQPGHPASHCPDLWRRYHNTIDSTPTLVESRRLRPHQEQYCSACARRGHLAHACRVSIPFSGLPINAPYVAKYLNIYPLQDNHYENDNQRERNTNQRRLSESQAMTHKMAERNKRQSKSPAAQEHSNKKRNMEPVGVVEVLQESNTNHERKSSLSEPARDANKSRSRAISETGSEIEKEKRKPTTNDDTTNPTTNVEKAQDFIPISSSNHNIKGQIIQDNEVSDTNDVVTVARIYVTSEIIEILRTDEGQRWLKENMDKHHVSVTESNVKMFLSIKGKLADQEDFQTELREWTQKRQDRERHISENQSESGMEVVPYNTHRGSEQNIPKNRHHLLRMLNKAFKSLSGYLGDPSQLFKELSYLQNLHSNQLKQKYISPKQLDNSSSNISKIMKKLNTVLLGQAGLADGAQHLDHLREIHQKITSCRSKNITLADRRSIGQHYHCIFNATPRDDYQELLQKFYIKDNHAKSGNRNCKPKQVRPPVQTPNANKDIDTNSEAVPKMSLTYKKFNIHRERVLTAAINRLKLVQISLLKFKAKNANHKKEKSLLCSKLHALLYALNSKANTKTYADTNTLKKVKNIRIKALDFLKNVNNVCMN